MIDICGKASAALKTAVDAEDIEAYYIGDQVKIVSEVKDVKHTAAHILLTRNIDRAMIEQPIDGILAGHDEPKKDKLHHKRGLDQVRAAILAKEGRALICLVSDIREAPNKPQAIGRMLHNVRVADKYGMPIIFGTGANAAEELTSRTQLEAFFESLGVSQRILVDSRAQTAAWIKRTLARSEVGYLGEGIHKPKAI